MLGRLGFAGRLMAIVLLALLAMQAVGTGIGYVARKKSPGEATALLPERAAAIVALLDAAGPEQRETLLKAVVSDDLRVALAPSRPAAAPGAERLPAIEWVVAQYLPEGTDREVMALIKPESGPRWRQLRIGQYWLASREPLRISIPLKSGGFALFETSGDIGPRIYGFPPGFFIGALGALVGIAALLAILREARPLRELAGSVARFSGETPVEPVRPRGAPEIKKLIGAVNDMQARLAALIKGRTVLLGAISHDLKTYITRLRLRAEITEDADQRERTVRDLDEMSQLLDNALAASRSAGGPGRKQCVDLVEILEREAKERPPGTAEVATEASLPALAVEGDPVSLRRLFVNVIDNAVRYGTRARITVGRRDGRAEVVVDDDGPGIPESERQAVLEPFYRIEPSRSRATGGTGLGLAIARQIVEAHGGTLAIETAPGGGARLRIEIPSVA